MLDLENKNISGIIAQVRNPRYIDNETPAMFRELINVKRFTENKNEWVQLYWKKENGDSCNFTGCTVKSNSCVIQLKETDFNNLKSLPVVSQG